MKKMRLFVLACVLLVPNLKADSSHKTRDFLDLSRLPIGIIAPDEANIHTWGELGDSGGVFVARINLSEKQLSLLLSDKFFDSWNDGIVPAKIAKETWDSVDRKTDGIPATLIPSLVERTKWLHFSANTTARLYVLNISNEKMPVAASLFFWISRY